MSIKTVTSNNKTIQQSNATLRLQIEAIKTQDNIVKSNKTTKIKSKVLKQTIHLQKTPNPNITTQNMINTL